VDPESLFVYGSLLFAEVLLALLDRVPNRVPASAPGWRVASLPGRVYPGLVRGPDTASGLLMTDLTPAEWRILDAFEDEAYELRPVTLSDGRAGWAYVCSKDPAASLDTWDAGLFSERDLPTYVAVCVAWRRRYPAS
jgi:gamma-glutamylcyclotransferase (GGCT)/AIG2-like uncharacterized protein YtfP